MCLCTRCACVYDVYYTCVFVCVGTHHVVCMYVSQVEDLASWLEVAKMRSNLTGTLLGGWGGDSWHCS